MEELSGDRNGHTKKIRAALCSRKNHWDYAKKDRRQLVDWLHGWLRSRGVLKPTAIFKENKQLREQYKDAMSQKQLYDNLPTTCGELIDTLQRRRVLTDDKLLDVAVFRKWLRRKGIL